MNDPIVYVIGSPLSRLVKIGWTTNLRNRLSSLQSGSPVELRVYRTYPGGRELEKWLHVHFKRSRKHGEWFSLAYDLEKIDTAVRQYEYFERWQTERKRPA